MPLILGNMFPKACAWLPKPNAYLVQLMFTVFSVLVLLESISEDRLTGQSNDFNNDPVDITRLQIAFGAIIRSIENCDKTKDSPEPERYLTAPHPPTLILSKEQMSSAILTMIFEC
ncbi:hypothetical protein ACEPPN_000335 [Leptodophora sp. 'Broadleaf-Isolate-01']